MMKNIFIYPNLRKDSARDILQPVCDQLRRDGVRLMLPKQMRVVPPIIEDADYMKTEDAVQFADMAVVLGGDGTSSVWRERRRRISCRCSASMSVTSAL